jgi:CubicO group peptidase (beta-lactamase class C family)
MRIKITTLLLAIILFICLNTNAQGNFKHIDSWLADNASAMGGRDILVIYKDGHIIYSHDEKKMNMRQKMLDRYAAKKEGEPADLDEYTLDTRQAIASCSKWLSAALVMTFVDEGKLKLTDTVGKFLPILTLHGKGNITISDCLSHLTAIKSPELREEMRDMKDINTMDGAIAKIADMPMEGEPGKVFHYSNVGLQIGAAVIEKISGDDFRHLFAEHIAKPLNMAHTDFGISKVPLPAGGAISTPKDYINFLVMILNKGIFNGKRILSEKSIAEMQVNRLTPDVKIAYTPAKVNGFGYGYGEWILAKDFISSPGLFGSIPWVDNDKKYAGFLMAFYINNKGRDERYLELKKLVDAAVN